MAYGFGSTLGTGASDAIITPNFTITAACSIYTRSNRHGQGGGTLGRQFAQETAVHILNLQRSGVRFPFATTDGNWIWADPSADGWPGTLVTYDGNAANDPVVTVDGAAQTLTETTAPVGSFNPATEPLYIGNRVDGTRNWDGQLAKVAFWNRILTDGEKAALDQGYSPIFFLRGLVLHYPLIGNLAGSVTAAATTAGTPLVTPHPRLIQRGGGEG